ncbi:MAG: glycerate kinase [Elusimicrobiales bacterium]|nr:glycerate kinase [Elusimicrobiales bacterium]
MKVLIAPNAFKGTLTAAEAGAAVARALRAACPRARAEVLPIADGGDGLLEALAPALGGKMMASRVEGPLGARLRARWLLAGRTAVIEMAEAAGLRRLAGAELRPLDASTRGVGQLMLEAARRGARELIVGLGGSASNDGGAGCAQAFGFSLCDARGREIPPGARGLPALAAIFPGEARARLKGVRVTGLADVRNPLCGRLGSARVFGPQKGARPREVAFLERALRGYARVLENSLAVDAARLRGGAAAGGLGAGLAAFFGAELDDGAAFVLQRTGFEGRLARARLLITGEGRFDEQTFYGKAPGSALAAARRLGVPALVVCGSSLVPAGALARRGVAGVIESGLSPRPALALERAAAAALPGLLARLGLPV